MGKVHQFEYFVHSVKDLLKDQAEDIRRMEEYLEKLVLINICN